MPPFQLIRYSGKTLPFPTNLASSNMPGSHGPVGYGQSNACITNGRVSFISLLALDLAKPITLFFHRIIDYGVQIILTKY